MTCAVLNLAEHAQGWKYKRTYVPGYIGLTTLGIPANDSAKNLTHPL